MWSRKWNSLYTVLCLPISPDFFLISCDQIDSITWTTTVSVPLEGTAFLRVLCFSASSSHTFGWTCVQWSRKQFDLIFTSASSANFASWIKGLICEMLSVVKSLQVQETSFCSTLFFQAITTLYKQPLRAHGTALSIHHNFSLCWSE